MTDCLRHVFLHPSIAGCLLASFAAVLGVVVAASPGNAQQFATDEATVATFGACQLEAWRGETETRIEPACHLLRNFEVTLGFGIEPGGNGIDEYTIEAKTVVRELTTGGVGIALMAGMDLHGGSDSGNGRLSSLFAVVPVSLSFGEDRFVLHGNLGWQYEPDGQDDENSGNDDAGRHFLTWATRGDLHMPWLEERFTLVGELFGEDQGRPEYQVGLRTRLLPDRLILDVSWGGHTAADSDGRGWVVGLGWTPPPFF